MADINIKTMIREYQLIQEEDSIRLTFTVCAQNPSLNPMLIAHAIERYLPECSPDFVRCRRLELLDRNGEIFR